MDRRHQVFVSSTFADLKEERSEIMTALLELDCFPAGMELFPATNSGAWELIKRVIDDSDYYCLVIGGRYGSVDADGVSYTEKEYDYALAAGKPVVAFLHAAPDQIVAGKTEVGEAGRARLQAFRAKVEAGHHCKFWSSPEDLGGKVSRSIINLRKSHPADGWVPGRFASDEKSRVELANLRAKVAELESQLAMKAIEAHPAISEFVGGDDLLECKIGYILKATQERTMGAVSVSWDTILKYVGPKLLTECTEEEFEEKLDLCFYHALLQKLGEEAVESSSIVIPYVVIDTVIVQLRALGLMIPGEKRRPVSEKKAFWKLSEAGEARLLTIRAIRKPGSSQAKPDVSTTALDDAGAGEPRDSD